jgi:leucyl-tRNA synthetase
MQTHWIGKSYGTEVDFQIENSDKKIKIFTTRPDTLFGVTFMAIPPEHPFVAELLHCHCEERSDKAIQSLANQITAFCEKVVNEDKIARSSAETTKEGIYTGRNCINPVNGDIVQIWITNYVLMDYGTGAVMAVPAHDQRDFEFSKKYNLPMQIVIQNAEQSLVLENMTEAYVEPGILVNSGKFTGMDSESSKAAITNWLTETGHGKQTTTYRLRDWGISRQRYWGNPIPVIYCDSCGIVLVPDSDLPVTLPQNVQVGKTTQNPLLSVEDWINVSCPKCAKPAKRETDTMDTFVCSSWYFARYTDPKNTKVPFDPAIANKWLPVDQYIGGIEHACMHLLYARFFHKFMRDIKLVDSDEPFARLLTQGMVLKDGHKMSKSKGNTVDPQAFIDRYGADTIRMFVLFASPPEKDVDWNDDAVSGCFRFLNRLWRFYEQNAQTIQKAIASTDSDNAGDISPTLSSLRNSTHTTIKKINADMVSTMQFNTNIAAIMEHFNELFAIKDTSSLNTTEKQIFVEAAMIIPKLLYPYAPHIAEEIWEKFYGIGFIHNSGVCVYNPDFTIKDEITYVVQILGKVRGKFDISASATDDEIKKTALELENVQKAIENKPIKKIIVVPGKLVSIVV